MKRWGTKGGTWRSRMRRSLLAGVVLALLLGSAAGCDDPLRTEWRQGMLTVATSGIDSLVSGLNGQLTTAISTATSGK